VAVLTDGDGAGASDSVMAWPDLVGRVVPLPGAGILLSVRQAELPQQDELCGPFCALLALRTAGVQPVPDTAPLDQEVVAAAAGTVLSAPPRPDSLPPGEPGLGVRRPLPQAADAADAGTSAPGLARAVGRLSGGRLAAVPASGPWTPGRLRSLLDLVTRRLADTAVTVLANIATGELWDPRAGTAELARHLDTGADAFGPPMRWRVGHFATLAGMLTGPAGSLVLVADSYRSLGRDGLHLQPVSRLAAALNRDGLAPGGVLLVVPATRRLDAADIVTTAGLRTALWDNGSPDAAADSGQPPEQVTTA
jgi:hypothetical protein